MAKAKTKAKKRKNEYICRACSTDFHSPIGLASHYSKVADNHLARALVKRYGFIPKEKWRRDSPIPNTKDGKLVPGSTNAVPMKRRSAPSRSPPSTARGAVPQGRKGAGGC